MQGHIAGIVWFIIAFALAVAAFAFLGWKAIRMVYDFLFLREDELKAQEEERKARRKQIILGLYRPGNRL